MRSFMCAAMAVVLGGGMMGCGNADAPTPKSNAPAAGDSRPNNPVAQVVHEFLEAVRQGNTPVASSRLTPLALKATAEHDLLFSPPASPTARFTVGEVEMVEDDKAVVESVWTDLDVDGKPNNESIVWALRRADGEWRISGMAAEMGPDQPPVVIDFENPAAMAQDNRPQPTADDTLAANPHESAPPQQVARDPFQQPTSR